jgi:predicted AlkP superfamily phosphohydrolase/phosphomutase/Flp pilus assembly protein TadD
MSPAATRARMGRFPGSFTKRRSGLAAALLLAVVLGLSCHRAPGPIVVLGLDGMDPRAVDLLVSEGKLPHFARLRQQGAYGRLLSRPPLLSPVIWTTIATGKTPDQHGIGHFTAQDEVTGEELPATSAMRRVKAIWNILTDAHKKIDVVGWWATWPAETVNGAVVSDHLCYHFLFPQGAGSPASAAGLTWPPELASSLAPLVRRPSDITVEEAAPFIHVSAAELARPFSFDDDVSHFKWALATADTYRRIGLARLREDRPDMLLVYVEATDSIAHLFGHVFRARGLAGELLEQQRKYGDAVEQTYVYADRIVGEYMDAVDRARGTLVVLSDHGFELGAVPDDPSKTRDMRRVSEKFHNPEGILYMYGARIKAHASLERAAIEDMAPTLLALAGVPAARDMPGRVLSEGLEVSVPGPRVATYESAPGSSRAAADRVADPEILERLRSLGYVGSAPRPRAAATSAPTTATALVPPPARETSTPPAGDAPHTRSPTSDRNIAAVHFQAGRYEEAARIYERLSRESPKDAGLLTSLAGALGALGRYDEAEKRLAAALEIQPLNAEARHNRAVILERKGDRAGAIEQYRLALRYSPQYAPSRKALLRLTGSAEVGGPRTPEEKKAYALAQAAADLARRGDYDAAARRLDEAEGLAPRYALLAQYRSNVAYLEGDLPGAIRALEKGLALEPDNALFRANLEWLRKQPPPRPVKR